MPGWRTSRRTIASRGDDRPAANGMNHTYPSYLEWYFENW